MANAFPLESENTPTRSREAWLSALPFALIGLGTMLVYIPQARLEDFQEAMLKVLLSALLVGFILALIWGGKRWAGGWFGFMLVLAVNSVPESFPNWDNYAAFNTLVHLNFSLALYVLLPLVVLGVFLLVFRGDRVRGLLMTLPWMFMLWLLFLEFVPPVKVTLVLLACTIILVSVAYWMTRAARFRYALGLAALAALLLGLVFMYAAATLTTLILRGRTLEVYLSELLPGLFNSLLVVIAPLLVLALWRAARRLGRMGRRGLILSLIGLLFVWLGNLGAFQILTASDQVIFRPTYGVALSWLGLLGWLLIVAGAFTLARAAHAGQNGMNRVAAPALALLCGFIPLVTVVIVAPGNSLISMMPPVSRLLFAFAQMPPAWTRLFTIAWLAFSAWLVVQLDDRPR